MINIVICRAVGVCHQKDIKRCYGTLSSPL